MLNLQRKAKIRGTNEPAEKNAKYDNVNQRGDFVDRLKVGRQIQDGDVSHNLEQAKMHAKADLYAA